MATTQDKPAGATGQNTAQSEKETKGTTQGSALQGSQSGTSVQQQPQRGLARYRHPLEMMERLSNEMDQLFDSFFTGRPFGRLARPSALQDLWTPEIDIREEGNQLRVCVDLPGVPKDNVKVNIEQGMLTVQGERHEERTEGGKQEGFHRTERRYGSFYRSIPLPEGADTEHAQATMKEGVLEVTLPIQGAKQGRRLQIQG